MQLENLRELNGGALTVQQRHRALEAYLLWLFGWVLFTSSHGETVDARWIAVAREITDARNRDEVTPRSWGSAVLASTFRALSTACYKAGGHPCLSGCPLLLQLWCYERFPIGRPFVNADEPYGPDFYPDDAGGLAPFGGPTFGSLWTRRQVSHAVQSYNFLSLVNFVDVYCTFMLQPRWAGENVARCYVSFVSQFDTLHDSQVIWQPYSTQAVVTRAPHRGVAVLCFRDDIFFMTSEKLVFDVYVRDHPPQRVMRQFGLHQEVPPPVGVLVNKATRR
jgi:hypothetical protein